MQQGVEQVQAGGYNALADFRRTTAAVEGIFSFQATGPGDVQRQLRDSSSLMGGLLQRTRHLDPDPYPNPNPYAEARQRLHHLSRDPHAPAAARTEAVALSHRLGGLEGHAAQLNGYLYSLQGPRYGVPLVPVFPPSPLAPLARGVPVVPYPCPPGTEAVCSQVVPVLPGPPVPPGRGQIR